MVAQDSWPLTLSTFSSFSFGMRVYMCMWMYIAYTYLCVCLCVCIYMFMELFMCYGTIVERGGGRRESVITSIVIPGRGFTEGYLWPCGAYVMGLSR